MEKDLKAYFAQVDAAVYYNNLDSRKKANINNIRNKISSLAGTDLTKVKWIGESTAEKLIELWYNSQSELKEANIEELSKKLKNPIAMKAIEIFIKW